MLYIFETEISENKSVFSGIRKIYGLGAYYANLICKKAGFSLNFKCRDLSKKQIGNLIQVVESLELDLSSDLKRKKIVFLNKLVSIKSFRGLRRIQGLPVRGQRTRSNARSAKKLRSVR